MNKAVATKTEGMTRILPNGNMPLVGLGCFFGIGKMSDAEIEKHIEAAIDMGYRCFDTAAMYMTEKPLGKALRNKMHEGVIKREDVYVTSKLMFDRHHPNEVKPAVQESLDNLGLDYLDQYLIHWPCGTEKLSSLNSWMQELQSGKLAMYEDSDYIDVWKILEECAKDGKLKSIGVSNFNCEQVQRVLDNCTIKPCVNQCEINPYYQNTELAKFCEEHGIAMVAYTPLGIGHVSSVGWQCPLKDPVIVELAAKYRKTVAQIALRFTVQRGIPVIPSSSNPDRMAENLKIFDFELNEKDMEKLYQVEKITKLVKMEYLSKHKDYPWPSQLKAVP